MLCYKVELLATEETTAREAYEEDEDGQHMETEHGRGSAAGRDLGRHPGMHHYAHQTAHGAEYDGHQRAD